MEEQNGFYFNDIQSDYYQIPSEDKEKIRIAEEKNKELKVKTIETNQDTSQNENKEDKIEINENQNDKENTKQEYREKIKFPMVLKDIKYKK